ncbi:hypothetical protein AVEN_65564-1 [Araneus ventricosus]|uniref:Uncharacterized protein n=1 Tax=Araneus ventricosus TaxID=182803 RepID=A0A4Y2PXY8_ARAVE|nr:hypothetical protein AVEN_65564-1 [Araneus ventricosus]
MPPYRCHFIFLNNPVHLSEFLSASNAAAKAPPSSVEPMTKLQTLTREDAFMAIRFTCLRVDSILVQDSVAVSSERIDYDRYRTMPMVSFTELVNRPISDMPALIVEKVGIM